MKYGNLTLGQIEALVNRLGGMESVERVLRDEVIIRLTPTSNEKEYIVTIDYTHSLEQMIKDGKYDWKNEDITSKNFPITGSGKVDIKLRLIHLNRLTTTNEVKAHLDTLGLQPAKIEHLLALGEKFPNLQRDYPIVAFGLVWLSRDGVRSVPCLVRGGSGRGLGLGWDDDDDSVSSRWVGRCRFLAVSK